MDYWKMNETKMLELNVEEIQYTATCQTSNVKLNFILIEINI